MFLCALDLFLFRHNLQARHVHNRLTPDTAAVHRVSDRLRRFHAGARTIGHVITSARFLRIIIDDLQRTGRPPAPN